jgi:hypothetical protein
MAFRDTSVENSTPRRPKLPRENVELKYAINNHVFHKDTTTTQKMIIIYLNSA